MCHSRISFKAVLSAWCTEGRGLTKGSVRLEVSGEHDFLLLLPHSKLEATGECGQLGPGPFWQSSTPRDPAWMASSGSHAEVTVAPTSPGQLGPMHSWSSGAWGRSGT